MVVQPQLGANSEIDGKSIRCIPDILISLDVPTLDREIEPLWIVECAFTQTREQAIKKFERCIADFSTVRALTLVNVTEWPEFKSPAMKSTSFRTLSRLPIQSYQQWSPGNRRESPMGPVITDGHRWASCSGIEIEVWIAKPGKILDLSDRGDSCYAFGVRRVLTLLSIYLQEYILVTFSSNRYPGC